MTARDVCAAISRRPFQPFVVNRTSGQSFTVSHPDAIWQAPEPDDNTVIIHVRDVEVVFTDAPDIADIVFAGRQTATLAEESNVPFRPPGGVR
jgi:hypothetical protein